MFPRELPGPFPVNKLGGSKLGGAKPLLGGLVVPAAGLAPEPFRNALAARLLRPLLGGAVVFASAAVALRVGSVP
jgi:hypothetical protein